MQIFLPILVRNKIKAKMTNKIIIIKKEMFNFDGGNIEENLKLVFINSVAKRFPVFVLNGPEIKPSMSGIVAEESIKDVNKKSAWNLFFRKAEKIVNREVSTKQITQQRKIARKAGSVLK